MRFIIDCAAVPSVGDTREQLAREKWRRNRLSAPAFGGGFLYLLSAITISETLNGAPTVGLLQGLKPAFSGEASPAVSPRTDEVKFISSHAFALIAGSTLVAIAIGVLTLILLLLLDATRFRRPQTWSYAGPLVIGGGIAVAVVSLAHQVVTAIETHSFAVGHDFSNHAVEQALTKGTANSIIDYVDLLAGLSLAAGMIAVMINALRVGLVPRWMGFLGMFAAILIFLPIGGAELQLVPAFWIVMMGILYGGRWPGGEPPAWQAGEAVPWPSRADMQSARGGKGQPALAGADAGPAPAPAASSGSSRKRRRKRGARG
jgi:hypothetical protein